MKEDKNVRIALLLILILITCCKRLDCDLKVCGELKKNEIQLLNDLSVVQICLPEYFDSTFFWTRDSDCGEPCMESYYRIQSKNLPINKEDGFIPVILLDSVESFTIIHPFLVERNSTNIKELVILEKDKEENLKHNRNYKYMCDSIFYINDKPLLISSRYKQTKNNTYFSLEARTIIDGLTIEFLFENRWKDSFISEKYLIDKYLVYLSTIEIK